MLKHNKIKPLITELTFAQLIQKFNQSAEAWNATLEEAGKRGSNCLLYAEGRTKCLIFCGGENDTYKTPAQAAGLIDWYCKTGIPRFILNFTMIS